MIKHRSAESESIKNFVQKDIDPSMEKPFFKTDDFWKNLSSTGTELWLDTGDIDEAARIWTGDMSALTTNNTLLNREIQKGIYDGYIEKADTILKGLDLKSRILEIAFILNARHGLRLVQQFGGMVSVELHTDFAHHFDGIVEYGRRFHEVCPNNFIIKVPYTATGLLGARKLREFNVPVNFTLEFSARQNALVAVIAKPSYLNVFLGRIGAYLSDNNLGNGELAGEKATLATQRIVTELTKGNPVPTRLIAASLRNADQLNALAGVDVFTIPTKVAADGIKFLSGEFSSKRNEDYDVTLNPGINAEEIGFSKLWNVTEKELGLAQNLDQDLPSNGEELEIRAREAGCADLFPEFTDEDYATLSADGKIPVHQKWMGRIAKGELAIDTLLNLAGLASFTTDQNQLDKRIMRLIGND